MRRYTSTDGDHAAVVNSKRSFADLDGTRGRLTVLILLMYARVSRALRQPQKYAPFSSQSHFPPSTSRSVSALSPLTQQLHTCTTTKTAVISHDTWRVYYVPVLKMTPPPPPFLEKLLQKNHFDTTAHAVTSRRAYLVGILSVRVSTGLVWYRHTPRTSSARF